MQLFLGAVPIILRLFSKARGHLLFSNYSRNNLPKPNPQARSSALATLRTLQPQAFGSLNRVDPLDSVSNYYL